MKQAYPIILTPSEHGYVVYVPDLDINTEGKDPADAIDMAADAIGLWGISAQALGREIPAPSAALPACAPPQMPWQTLTLTTAIPYDCPAAPASAGAALFMCPIRTLAPWPAAAGRSPGIPGCRSAPSR